MENDFLSFKNIPPLMLMDYNTMDSEHNIGYNYYMRNILGLEIMKPDFIMIVKPKYWCPDYIKNGKFFWYPDIKMMRRICRKLKSNK